jgi:Ran GTPase-activating protein (RanGAP) involved in mRNA processing and transport
MKANNLLETIDLSTNKIGDTGLRYISEALKGNTALKVLLLKNNNITSEGARSLAEGLAQNNGLVEVRLQLSCYQ